MVKTFERLKVTSGLLLKDVLEVTPHFKGVAQNVHEAEFGFEGVDGLCPRGHIRLSQVANQRPRSGI